MARVSLAAALAKQERWDEVRVLVAECESAELSHLEPDYKADWDRLLADLARHPQ